MKLNSIFTPQSTQALAFIVAVLVLATLPAPVHSAAAVAEDEPSLPQPVQEFILSETVYPQEKGEVQLTLSSIRQRFSDSRQQETALKVEYGITDRFQLEIELPYLRLRPLSEPRSRGISDISVSALYNFLPGNKPFALSAAVEVELPTGNQNKGLGEGQTRWAPSIIVAREYGKMQVHLGVGAEMGGEETELFYNLATVYTAGGKLYPTLELNGTRSRAEGSRLYLTPGLVYKIARNTELGLGWPLGMRDGSEKYGPVAKFTVEF